MFERTAVMSELLLLVFVLVVGVGLGLEFASLVRPYLGKWLPTSLLTYSTSSYTQDEHRDCKTGQDWSAMDVEDLRDFAKAMTIDDLTIAMARSRHEIQKKLIELGLSATKGAPNDTPEG